jgi:hypothetical protein
MAEKAFAHSELTYSWERQRDAIDAALFNQKLSAEPNEQFSEAR